MTDLDSLLSDIATLDDDADDQVPWRDAARWSPNSDLDDDLTFIPVAAANHTLTARLGDGRTAIGQSPRVGLGTPRWCTPRKPSLTCSLTWTR